MHAAAPQAETRHGIEVLHPRYPVIPKVGMSAAPWLLYRAMVPVVARLLAEGRRFDAIDAHYVYPDGVAATWLGKRFGLPVVMTARGTDVNLIPRFRQPRRLIQAAIRDCAAMVAVSAALKEVLVDLGAPDDKVTVLRNGVETDLFRPAADREALRQDLGVTGKVLISVGRPDRAQRPSPHDRGDAVAAGFLPADRRRRAGTGAAGRADRAVRPRRSRPTAGAAPAYRVAEALRGGGCLGAGVVAGGLGERAAGIDGLRHAGRAANIWGNPEVVRAPEAGVIFEPNTPDGIAEGRAAACSPTCLPREATRAYAEPFSWDETTAGQLTIFRRVRALSDA